MMSMARWAWARALAREAETIVERRFFMESEKREIVRAPVLLICARTGLSFEETPSPPDMTCPFQTTRLSPRFIRSALATISESEEERPPSPSSMKDASDELARSPLNAESQGWRAQPVQPGPQ
jgi:hypothetical protein